MKLNKSLCSIESQTCLLGFPRYLLQLEDITSSKEIDYASSTTALYYGDSNVKIGQPFSITCIIPISNPIHWLKDDEPITRHNLRHGRDEHSYILTESAIEGEKHKIEAHIMVRHALKVHEGKYRCNDLHSNYHLLRVHTPLQEPRPQTRSPFIILSGDNNEQKNNWQPYEPTESISIYETIPDLTPSSTLDNIFTHTPATKQTAIVTATRASANAVYKQQHHQHQQQMEREKNKFAFINASDNFDGNHLYTTSDNHQNSNEQMGFVNYEYIQPTNTTIATGIFLNYTPHSGDHYYNHHKHQNDLTNSKVPWHIRHQATTNAKYPNMPQNINDYQQQQLTPTAPLHVYDATQHTTLESLFNHNNQIFPTQTTTINANQQTPPAISTLQPKGNMKPFMTNQGESLVIICCFVLAFIAKKNKK